VARALSLLDGFAPVREPFTDSRQEVRMVRELHILTAGLVFLFLGAIVVGFI
jgi:hypothetical protein